MTPLFRTGFIIAALMFAASVSAVVLRPTHFIAKQEQKIVLNHIVPAKFGNWAVDPNQPAQVVNPVQKENLERIYTDLLSRTYVNANGYRVMLSIAYGDDQRSGLALGVHYPEVCYPAQGFVVKSNHTGSIQTVHGNIPVKLLETMQSDRRYEPVTYWITLGQRVTLGGIERRLIELDYGLRGEIPDGLLFRVSSIDRDSSRAFGMQEKFISDLIQALQPEQRIRLAGNSQP